MPRPQRVLFLPKWYPDPSDPQLGVFLREQAEVLAEKVSISLLYAYPDPELKKSSELRKERSRGFTEFTIHYRARGNKAVRAFRYMKAMWQGWKAVLREDGHPEILHAHILNRPALFAFFIRLRYGIPFLISEQWSGFLNGNADLRPWLSRKLTPFLLRRADGISAVSEQLAEALKERGAPNEIRIVPNTTIDPGTPRIIPTDPFRFFNISDMVDELKGLSELIEAFDAVKQERKEAMELHIVGGGSDEAKLRELAAEKGLLGDSVLFYGRLPNEAVHQRFPEMSALVVNSIHETFSVVTVESLAHGRPVIASKCGGPEEILKDEKLGFLFQKGNTEATREAMHRIIERIDDFDPEALHRYAVTHYGRAAVRDRFLELYEQVL